MDLKKIIITSFICLLSYCLCVFVVEILIEFKILFDGPFFVIFIAPLLSVMLMILYSKKFLIGSPISIFPLAFTLCFAILATTGIIYNINIKYESDDFVPNIIGMVIICSSFIQLLLSLLYYLFIKFVKKIKGVQQKTNFSVER